MQPGEVWIGSIRVPSVAGYCRLDLHRGRVVWFRIVQWDFTLYASDIHVGGVAIDSGGAFWKLHSSESSYGARVWPLRRIR